MSSTMSPPPGGDVNLGPSLTALYLTLSIIAFLLTCFRVVIRLKEHHFGAEDICSAMAAVIFLGIAGMVAYAAQQGIYRHKYYLTLQQIELGLLTSTIGEGLIGISETFGKIAIALLLIRLIDRTASWRTWVLWSVIAVTIVICIITVFITFFQCKNPRAIWELALQAKTVCWDKAVLTKEAIVCSSWYTAVDFILAFFPLTIIWDLISLRRKVALAILLGLGAIAGIFCAIKTSLLPVLAHDTDASFQQYDLQLFTALETFLLIVLGCVPVLKRPMEYAIRQASQSTLISSVRRFISHTSIESQNHNSSVGRHYTYPTNDKMAFPLQDNLGAGSDFLAEAEANESESKTPGIQVVKSYQVV